MEQTYYTERAIQGMKAKNIVIIFKIVIKLGD